MRLALISDVHANLEALNAVLDHARPWADAFVCAGDIVGFGPDPDAVVDRLRAVDARCVWGNHDAMVLGRLGTRRCVVSGVRAVVRTREVLRPDTWRFLAALPASVRVGDVFVCHAHPDDVQRYLASPSAAAHALERVARLSPDARFFVCGHTHHPMVWSADAPWRRPAMDAALAAPPGLVMVNPGSVGQSRDAELVARYARLDTEAATVTFHALAYDHAATERKLRAAGLDSPLCRRTTPRWRRPTERVLRMYWSWRAAGFVAPV